MTTASTRPSSSRASGLPTSLPTRLRAALLWAAVASVGAGAGLGCVEQESGVTGTTSLRVVVTAPADLGSATVPLPDSVRTVTLGITALDELGATDTTFSAPVDVYTHFLGTLSPERQGAVTPLSVTLAAGVGTVTLDIPAAFGPTFLWVEDADDMMGARTPTYATGTSPILWYREPLLEDISRPVDDTLSSALEVSPLMLKQVTVAASKHGAAGYMVVTGVYAQGYTLSDVTCSGMACTADPYNHIFVFTFGRPRAEDGTAILQGDKVATVAGGVGEFNGFTELNFPQTTLVEPREQDSLMQSPTVIDPVWLNSTTGPTGMINLERVESGLVAVDGMVVCPLSCGDLDQDYDTYGQWKLDMGAGCCFDKKPSNKTIKVITRGQVTDFDPATVVGQTLPRVAGTLKSVNIGTFNIWIVLPRTIDDITLP